MPDPKRSAKQARGQPSGQAPGRPADRPRVVVCDEGELQDVFELLARLEPQLLRVRPADLGRLADWERPSRLFVTSVRIAWSSPLPLTGPAGELVSIAVASSDAQLQCSAMLRRGFRYVVRRPVHPEALRLLLMQVLWRGKEHREVARFPFGAEVRWRRGLRSGHCTMLEISAHGCRLACREPFRLGERVRLRVPAALTGSRDLRLRGRIVRRDRLSRPDQPVPQLALQFEGLSGRSLAHLDALLAERASGPALATRAAPGRDAGSGGARAVQRDRSRLPSPTRRDEPAQPHLATPATAPALERRRRARGAWRREVVALEHEGDRVLHTLFGSDLSVGGLRVEPNPLLRIGDRLRLALYDAGEAEPLVVAARVAHDQGRSGVGLVFVETSEAARGRLERMVAALPPLSSLGDDGDKAQSLVLGEIVSLDPSRIGPPTSSGRAAQPQQREREHDQQAAEHHDPEPGATHHEPTQH